MMKTFYKLKKARRQASSRWSGFRHATGYAYRGRVWLIPKEYLMGGACVKQDVNYFLDKMMELEQKEANDENS